MKLDWESPELRAVLSFLNIGENDEAFKNLYEERNCDYKNIDSTGAKHIKIKAIVYDISQKNYRGEIIYGCGVTEKGGNTYIATFDARFIQIVEGSERMFTGIKDKNGEEIYTGDILRIACIRHPFKVYMENLRFKVIDLCNLLEYPLDDFKNTPIALEIKSLNK